ncbi:MAG: peptide-methionine (S)-S-oxide reductase MsrA [Chthoniobacterales bacterium]|nr:peptide-methionine (S)-S-oxide reductase MsrA [Chthoniobacterales bacterium]
MKSFRIIFAFLLILAAAARTSIAAETETAVFGAGCFWCVEAFYEQQPGVKDVVSGYAGGAEANPNYKQVSAGSTGHAEVVQVKFDPAVTSYEKLVEFFWKTHDVTDGRGVAPDFGKQYRPLILFSTPEQQAVAEKSKAALAARLGKPVAAEIVALEKFYLAVDYHQDYVRRNPKDGYVVGVAIPKLKKLGLKLPGE